MKKRYAAVAILAAINLALCLALAFLLPDQVPVHFGPDGAPDHVVGKFEALALMAAIPLVVGIVWIVDTRANDGDNTQVKLKVGALVQLLFIGINLYLGLCVFSRDSALLPTVSQLGAASLGIPLIVLGNYLPKTERGSLFGIGPLRWSANSAETWQRTQRLGGWATVAAGLVALLCGILFTGDATFTALWIVFLAWTGTCGIISRIVYQHDRIRATGGRE